MLFPFTNSRVDISAFNIYCGQSSFSITARYPDWVNEIMGEALWREICLIVNKPKRNVKLKSVTGQVHCKRKKCCAYEPFTAGVDFYSNVQKVNKNSVQSHFFFTFKCIHSSSTDCDIQCTCLQTVIVGDGTLCCPHACGMRNSLWPGEHLRYPQRCLKVTQCTLGTVHFSDEKTSWGFHTENGI